MSLRLYKHANFLNIQYGSTALIEAAREGESGTVALLLQLGADIEAKNIVQNIFHII